MNGAKAVVAALCLVGAASAMLWAEAAESARPAPPITCSRAVLVDERLRCDDETPDTLARICGPLVTDRPLLPGDVVQSRACRGEPIGRMSPDALAVLEQPIDVNYASTDELESLPGVGPKTAERIVRGRPYHELEDLLRVHGIGPVRLARMRSRVVLRP